MRNIFFYIAFISALASCKKNVGGDDSSSSSNTTLEDLKVPNGFDWSTQRTIQVNVQALSQQATSLQFYDANPADSGLLLGIGGALVNSSFNGALTVLKPVSELYIVSNNPMQSRQLYKTSASGNVAVDLATLKPIETNGVELTPPNPVSPDCSGGCSVKTALVNNANIEVSGGKTICAEGSNLTFNVTYGTGGGTLRICGTGLTIQNLNNNANGSNVALIITAGASLSVSNLNFNRPVETVTNYGTLHFTNNYAGGGPVTNYGTLTVKGDYNINNSSAAVTHKNYGNVTISNSLNINSGSTFTNQSKTTIGSDLRVNSGATLVNACSIIVDGEYQNSNLTHNYGYLKVAKTAYLNSNSNLQQYGSAMLQCNYLQFNGTLTGNNSTSLVKVATKTNFNSSGLLTGFVQLCSANGFDANSGKVQNGAAIACNVYIEKTDCNPEGNGKPVCTDTDKDGVCDNDDAYPNDPDKAYNNPVPTGTVAFEDNWPWVGDYDLNDVIIEYNYNVVTNAANKVTRVEGSYLLRAAGGANKNGFGVQFPVERGKVSNVTGATLETGQSKAVVILFTDMHNEIPQWNTFKNQAVVKGKVYNISFDISNGPALSAFGLNEYNPFIYNGTKGRGFETHLAGKQPTDLVSKSDLGTGLDQTSIGGTKNYVTKNKGLMWALHIPIRFDYPAERIPINEVYLKFNAWVESGGTLYPDWYKNIPGYRTADPAKIFVW